MNISLSYRVAFHLIKIIDFILAIVLAIFFGMISQTVYTMPHTIVIWIVVFSITRLFVFNQKDCFNTFIYWEAFKITLVTFVIYLLIAATLRVNYSLHFISFITLSWLLSAWIIRKIIISNLKSISVCTYLDLSENFTERFNISCTVISDAAKVKLQEFDLLIVDYANIISENWVCLLTHARVVGMPIYSIAELEEKLEGKFSLEQLQQAWLHDGCFNHPIYFKLKRFIDIVLTIIFLPILLLLSGVVAILVFILSGRPILFYQERVGQDNKLFKLYKFRTMEIDAEKNGPAWTNMNDNRITWLGKYLRKMRLDELPQFFNVLRGEMSIVGPRPTPEELVSMYSQEIEMYQIRHWVKPGITGWAQVLQVDIEDIKNKLRYDIYYVKYCSLWLDFVILIRTVFVVLFGVGAR